jgi:MoaA/NifB/PqqE/SkfB family radical SAM enzyme
MTEYSSARKVAALPRIPLEGVLDLTYRCNNDCRHCWLWLPVDAPEAAGEMAFDEIRRVVEEARSLGCRKWSISGGEPMLRPDFPEIFDHITANSAAYTLNTNGTLITPRIAGMMRRPGKKWVALYGATAEVHDRVTRNPGSFDAFLRGVAYLREAGADFTVQVIPMRDNVHQIGEMKRLAASLGPDWRIGIGWLYLSASGDPRRNDEIRAQRLTAKELDEVERLGFSERISCVPPGDDRLFAPCIEARRDFHIDAYGRMSFCDKVKAPGLRFDLRTGSFRQAWEEFIPAVAERVRGGREYLDGCGACERRKDCDWCPAYGYLEHRDLSARVDYLCGLAGARERSREDFLKENRRYYHLGGLTVQVDSDLPITDSTFAPKFRHFEVERPGEDVVRYSHHFEVPALSGPDLGEEVHRAPPWAIYKKKDSWIYVWTGTAERADHPALVAVFNADHTRGRIYAENREAYLRGGILTLSFFPTDQLPLGPVLADRKAFFLHSSGLVLDGRGLLFVGHSEAGKSTVVKMLKGRAQVLCDDRIIVRRWPEGFRIHGTWGHGEVPDVSPGSAPLDAVFFLEKSDTNALVPIKSGQDVLRRLWACLIKGFTARDWWDKVMPHLEGLAREVPCYILRFDKSGAIVGLLEGLFSGKGGPKAPAPPPK